MNSKLKGLIVCGVFVVCLVGVALALKFMSPAQDDDSSVSSSAPQQEPAIPIVDYERAQVKNISITNEFGELNISQPKLGEEKWTVDQLDGIEVETVLTASAASTASKLEAKDVAEENASDLDKYGLAQPAAQFTVSYSDKDHSVRTFLIGDESPEKGYRYLCEKDTNKVYIVAESSLLPFMSKMEYFVTLSMLPAPENENDWPTIKDLVVSRSDWDYQVKFRTEEDQTEGIMSMQVMYEPIYMSLNISQSTDITHGMWGLTASDTVKAFPTEEDMKEYGLDSPRATVELSTEEGDSYTLKIGSPVYATDETGKETQEIVSYYACIDGVEGRDAIYIVQAEMLPWADFKMEDVITALMTTNPIADVESVTITGDNADHKLELVSNGDEVTQAKLDGSDVDLDLAKSFYQELISCPTNEIYFEKTKGEPYMTVSINLRSGDADVLEFVKDTDRRTIVLLNGRPQFRIASNWTELFLENVRNLAAGDPIKKFV